MLEMSKLLKFIKLRCALPSGFIEKNDEELRDYIIETSLPTFSKFYPDVVITTIPVNDPEYRHPTQKNCYFIKDDETCPIFGVKECYFDMAGELLDGMPLMGAWSFSTMNDWALEAFKHRTFHKFSNYNYMFEFFPPNMIRIPTDFPPSNFAVEYERQHPDDLRTIRAAHEDTFKQLALGDVKMLLGEIRLQYTEIQTPNGIIPINGQFIYDQGRELRENIMSKMEDDYRPMSFIIKVE